MTTHDSDQMTRCWSASFIASGEIAIITHSILRRGCGNRKIGSTSECSRASRFLTTQLLSLRVSKYVEEDLASFRCGT